MAPRADVNPFGTFEICINGFIKPMFTLYSTEILNNRSWGVFIWIRACLPVHLAQYVCDGSNSPMRRHQQSLSSNICFSDRTQRRQLHLSFAHQATSDKTGPANDNMCVGMHAGWLDSHFTYTTNTNIVHVKSLTSRIDGKMPLSSCEWRCFQFRATCSLHAHFGTVQSASFWLAFHMANDAFASFLHVPSFTGSWRC